MGSLRRALGESTPDLSLVSGRGRSNGQGCTNYDELFDCQRVTIVGFGGTIVAFHINMSTTFLAAAATGEHVLEAVSSRVHGSQAHRDTERS